MQTEARKGSNRLSADPSKPDAVTLVDGHVHLYDVYDRGRGLDAATEAFRSARREEGLAMRGTDCLVVVDPTGDDGFDRLRDLGAEGWSISSETSSSVRAVRAADAASLLVFAGRQIRAVRGLEVLAFFTRREFEEDLPLEATVEQVLSADATPVVPWGFGKWWGTRGRAVERLLESPLGKQVLVCDSSGRPTVMPEPRAFDIARRRGIPVVAGSDPLPFAGEERKIARYGFVLPGDLDGSDPVEVLKRKMSSDSIVPGRYGNREHALSALRLQLAMQLRRFRTQPT